MRVVVGPVTSVRVRACVREKVEANHRVKFWAGKSGKVAKLAGPLITMSCKMRKMKRDAGNGYRYLRIVGETGY